MVWKFYEDKQPTETIINTEHSGNWWCNSISKTGIYLTKDTAKKVLEELKIAVAKDKPYTFFLGGNVKSKLRRIKSFNKEEEFYLVTYGDDFISQYNPDKITNLKTNSVNIYYDWKDIPLKLKEFILDKKEGDGDDGFQC